MVEAAENGLTRKEQLFRTLRREIYAAEMKVLLDKELGRDTSSIVKRLAAVKLHPRTGLSRPPAAGTDQTTFHGRSKEELFRTLRREIFAAEMKVILDEQLGRETSPVVKRLAAVKLSPRAGLSRAPADGADSTTFHGRSKEELFRTLRREIFAAEMKVILDEQLGRETSPIVKRLAAMKLQLPVESNKPFAEATDEDGA